MKLRTLSVLRCTLLTPMLFLVTFQLSIPLFVNSIIIVGVFSLLLIFSLNKKGWIKLVLEIIFSKESLYLFVLFTIPFVYAIASTIVKGINDVSILPRYFTTIVHFFCVLFFCLYVYLAGYSRQDISISFIGTLLLQAIIVVVSFSSDGFLSAIRFFQFDSAIARLDEIGGGFARGLTLSGPLFFGLACSLGFTILCLFISEFNGKNRVRIYILLSVLALLFTVTARTVLVPPAMFAIYLACSVYYKSKWLLVKSITLSIIGLVAFVFFYEFYLKNIISGELVWAIDNSFELIFNYIETGSLSTKSTDHLDTMYFPLSESTLLFGDSRYVDANTGNYYMGTDAGYMRMALLMGVPFSLFLFAFDVVLLYGVASYLVTNNREKLIAFSVLTVVFAVLHYKGDIWAYTFPLHSVVLIFYFLNRINLLDKRII